MAEFYSARGWEIPPLPWTNLSPPFSQIGVLEESLGVSLFHRHARGLIPTEQGDLLYNTVHDGFSKLNIVEGLLTETKENPGGTLRVTTTVAFGSVWLTSRLKEFVRAYPSIE